jgi:hypothetical protein
VGAADAGECFEAAALACISYCWLARSMLTACTRVRGRTGVSES